MACAGTNILGSSGNYALRISNLPAIRRTAYPSGTHQSRFHALRCSQRTRATPTSCQMHASGVVTLTIEPRSEVEKWNRCDTSRRPPSSRLNNTKSDQRVVRIRTSGRTHAMIETILAAYGFSCTLQPRARARAPTPAISLRARNMAFVSSRIVVESIPLISSAVSAKTEILKGKTMKPGEYYQQALAKHQWAKQHIDKLDNFLAHFRTKNLRAIEEKHDQITGDVTYYVTEVPPVPVEIPLIVGDALQSLRCALDYVACGMVVAGGGAVTSKTKFPIVKVATDWEVSGLRMVAGAHQLAIEALRRIQPYEGGNYFLWALHRLNNIDKHRLLLAVCLINSARTISPYEEAAKVNLTEPGLIADTSLGRVRIIPRESPAIPLYAGQELLTLPMSQSYDEMCFFIDVAVTEPGIAESTPVLMLLYLMLDEIGRIIRDLARFLP